MVKLGTPKLLNASFGNKIEHRTYTRRDPFARIGPSNRWVLLVVLIIIFFVVGLGRLADLQIVSGSYYRGLAEGNRIRRIPVKAERGEILDRNNITLARNTPVYKLATFTTGGVVEKTEKIERERALRIIAIGGEEASRLLIDVGREYPQAEIAAHLVGYVNEANSDEIGKVASCQYPVTSKLSSYQLEDLVGRMGIEKEYECILRGTNGEELIEVDARGRLVRRLGRRDPRPGSTIKLTIDSGIQETAYEALKSAPDEKGLPRRSNSPQVKGAVVVTDSQNRVLALVSFPAFNPNEINQKYNKWSEDPALPFFNRAIGGAYHPGSTFKIITSVAGLEEGVLDVNFKYTDVGYVEAGGLKFRNWYFTRFGKGEGEMNIVKAITRSTDTFFYIAGEKVGIDSLAAWAEKFGLGKKLGIDLPGEAAGLMPNPDWKLKTKGERWYLGNTYNTSIGQGDVAATPLQINQITSIIASGGKICPPHVIDQESQISNFKFQISNSCRDLRLKEETLDLVRQGMVGACSPGGTAGIFFNFTPRVACKTGTAETVGEKTHAWFTAYGSAEGDSQAQIVATALVEEAGEGSVVAAPVVKKILEKYFGK